VGDKEYVVQNIKWHFGRRRLNQHFATVAYDKISRVVGLCPGQEVGSEMSC